MNIPARHISLKKALTEWRRTCRSILTAVRATERGVTLEELLKQLFLKTWSTWDTRT